MMTKRAHILLLTVVWVAVFAAACKHPKPPIAKPTTAPAGGGTGTTSARPPEPPTPVTEPRPVPPEPISEDPIASRDIGDINKNSPFQPVFFLLDSSDVDKTGQQA